MFNGNQQGVSYDKYAIGSSIICRGTKEEKTLFTFRLFDSNGYITKDEFNTLWTALQRNPFFFSVLFETPIELYTNILDVLFRENGTSTLVDRIDFEEYKNKSIRNNLFWNHHKNGITSNGITNTTTTTIATTTTTTTTAIATTTTTKLSSNKPLELQTKWAYVARFLSLHSQPNRILKATKNGEIQFYKTVASHHPSILPFVPRFFGLVHTTRSDLIMLEDLKSYFKTPILMDVKMGTCTANQFYTPDKYHAKQLAKQRNGQTLNAPATNGFRIISIQNPSPNNNINNNNSTADITAGSKGGSKAYTVYTKLWSKARSPTDIVSGFKVFLGGGTRHGKMRVKEIEQFVHKMKAIYEWAERNTELKLISSSLLFMMEGEAGTETTPTTTTTTVQEETPKPLLNIIDFEHVYYTKDKTKDDGFLLGLGNLIENFQRLLRETQQLEKKTENTN